MTYRWSSLFVLAILGAGCKFESSCGKKVEHEDLQKKIATALETDSGLTGAKVQCPEGVEVKTGQFFDCQVALPDGTSRAVTVSITDVEDKQFSYDLAFKPRAIPTAKFEASMGPAVSEKVGATVTVECGSAALTDIPDSNVLRCEVDGPPGKAPIEFTFDGTSLQSWEIKTGDAPPADAPPADAPPTEAPPATP